jgi:hypothetical protein
MNEMIKQTAKHQTQSNKRKASNAKHQTQSIKRKASNKRKASKT